jgi:hypothetical protein
LAEQWDKPVEEKFNAQELGLNPAARNRQPSWMHRIERVRIDAGETTSG